MGNLLGVDPLTNTLYALSHHGLAIMRSHDFGESWFAIKPDVLDAARDSESFVPCTSLSEEILLEMELREVVFASSQWNDTWGGKSTVHVMGNAIKEFSPSLATKTQKAYIHAGLYASFFKGQGHRGIFSLAKSTL